VRQQKFVLKEPPTKEIIVEKPALEEPPEEKVVVDHFAVAEEYWLQKDYDNALAAYDRYLYEFPSGDRVRDALTRKAGIYYDRGQYDEALPLLVEVIDDYPVNEERAEINLLLAKTYFHLGKYSESRLSALQWLELFEDYPGKEELFFLLGQNAKELEDRPRALYWWLKVLESEQTTEEQEEEIRSQLLDLIYESTEEDLKEMADYAREGDLIFPIYYRLANSFLLEDRLEEAQEVAIKIMRFASEGEWFLSKGNAGEDRRHTPGKAECYRLPAASERSFCHLRAGGLAWCRAWFGYLPGNR